MKNNIELAIAKGLSYLEDQQLSNGGFVSTSFSNPSNKLPEYSYQTVFVPSIILGCLSGLANLTSQQISARLAHFLLRQRGPDWSFNYWVKGTTERKTFPYPNDLDDSFCALAGLQSFNSRLLSSRSLAQVVRLLVACENQIGGPYHSWVVSNQSQPVWRDVDLAVNSNIAYFLKLIGIKLPRLQAYLEQRIASRSFSSAYYPSDFPSLYFLARAYEGPYAARLTRVIKERWQQKKLTPLQTALCITALSKLDAEQQLTHAMAKRLLASQQADGSWKREAFCLDPSRDGKKYSNGSAALTTAFAIEALNCTSKNCLVLRQTCRPKPLSTTSDDQLFEEVKLAVRQELAQHGRAVKQPGLRLMNRLLSSSVGREIALLPHQFARSWQATSCSYPANTFIELGMANLLGWMAYTAYDDIVDEGKNLNLLPVANLCLRTSSARFKSNFSQDIAFKTYTNQVFDQIDEANAWELANCRFPAGPKTIWLGELPHFDERMVLAQRSLGHILGPIGAAVIMGMPLATPALQEIEQGLRHYLIARQLQDDLHDWQEDLQAGRISYVVAEILRELGVSGHQQLKDLLPAMQRQFWHHSLSNICDVVSYHLRQSRSLLVRSHCLGANSEIFGLITKLEQVTAKDRTNQAEARGFLDGYNIAVTPRILTLP